MRPVSPHHLTVRPLDLTKMSFGEKPLDGADRVGNQRVKKDRATACADAARYLRDRNGGALGYALGHVHAHRVDVQRGTTGAALDMMDAARVLGVVVHGSAIAL